MCHKSVPAADLIDSDGSSPRVALAELGSFAQITKSTSWLIRNVVRYSGLLYECR